MQHQVQGWSNVLVIQVCLFTTQTELGILLDNSLASYPHKATFVVSFSSGWLYYPLHRAAPWNQSEYKDSRHSLCTKAHCQEHMEGGLWSQCGCLWDSLEDPAMSHKHHRRFAAAWAEGLTTSYVTPPRGALEVESFRWPFARCCLWGLGGSGTCSLTLSPKQPNLLPSQTFCKSCTFNRACKKTKGLLLK